MKFEQNEIDFAEFNNMVYHLHCENTMFHLWKNMLHSHKKFVCVYSKTTTPQQTSLEKTKKAYLYFTEVGTLEQTRLWVP